jgi:hypothetical protein
MTLKKIRSFSAFFFVLILLCSCSSVKEIKSGFGSQQIKIDGDASDWEGKLSFDKKNRLATGFQNDGENLYICITTSERDNIMKMLRLGTTIWFEPQNGGKKIGLKFPLPEPESFRDVMFAQRADPDFRENMEARFNKIITTQHEISVVNEDDYSLYLLDAHDENNFTAKLGLAKGILVYELKVPLSTNPKSKYFIEAKPGENLLIGISTNEFKMEGPMNRSGGGMNQGGGGRQPSGGMGGGRRQGETQGARNPEINFDKIELNYSVLLSKNKTID